MMNIIRILVLFVFSVSAITEIETVEQNKVETVKQKSLLERMKTGAIAGILIYNVIARQEEEIMQEIMKESDTNHHATMEKIMKISIEKIATVTIFSLAPEMQVSTRVNLILFGNNGKNAGNNNRKTKRDVASNKNNIY
jgi:hypothetical protein